MNLSGIAAAAAAVMCVGGAALAEDLAGKPLTVDDVLWDQSRPVPRFFPIKAAIAGKTGRARLRCRIGEKGYVERCKVESEDPPDLDFGIIAFDIANHMGVGLKTKTGEPTVGREFVVSFAFNLSDDNGGKDLTPPGPAVSPDENGQLISMAEVGWQRLPSGNDFARYYPRKALDHGARGIALIVCRIEASGALENCRAVAEDPSGYGFAEAAEKIFKLKANARPSSKGGEALAGRVVTIMVRFLLG